MILSARALAAFSMIVLATGCCFDQLTSSPGVSVAPTAPPSGLGTGRGPQLPGSSTSSGLGTPISFGAGTTPDPTIVVGMAGGPVSSSALDPSCYGHVQMAPSHVLTVTSPVAVGRIMAFSTRSADLTLMVRLPSGQFLCNDDSDGLNPQIETTLLPGDYQIYVGTYSAGAGEPYELGVSANPSITASTLHYPPPFVPSATGGSLMVGTATVSSFTGYIAGIATGTACTYSQTRVTPILGSAGTQLDCRWQVTCGAVDVYGGSTGGGYQPCADPTWPMGTFALDTNTTTTDQDPTFVFVGSRITISDDASGYHSTFTLTLDTPTPPTPAVVVPSAPLPSMEPHS